MARLHEVRIEPLTEAAFAPFGHVIAAKDRSPDFRGGGGTLGWAIDFVGGQPLVMFLQTPYQGFTFTKLERHFHVTQTFMPLGGSPAVVAVAAPSEAGDRETIPDPDRVRAFLLDGRAGYALAKGTWHSLDRFPLYPPATNCVMITDRETQEDLKLAYAGKGGWALTQEVDYGARFGVTFQFAL